MASNPNAQNGPSVMEQEQVAHPQSSESMGTPNPQWKSHTAPPRDASGNDIYDHEKYPLGPPSIGKYKPKSPGQKYRLLYSQYVGEDGVLYLAGVPGRDIVPESHKHPEGLARWPEKFQPLVDNDYARASRGEESIEELEARLTELRARNQPPSLQGSGSVIPPPGDSTIDHMTVEELAAYAAEQEINLGNAKTRDQMLKRIKQVEGLK